MTEPLKIEVDELWTREGGNVADALFAIARAINAHANVIDSATDSIQNELISLAASHDRLAKSAADLTRIIRHRVPDTL